MRDGAQVTGASLVIERSTASLKVLSIWLRDADGALVARVEGVLLRAVSLGGGDADAGLYHLAAEPSGLADRARSLYRHACDHFAAHGVPELSEGRLLLRAHMRSALLEAMWRRAGPSGEVDLAVLFGLGDVAEPVLEWWRLCLGELAAAGLLDTRDGKAILAERGSLPDADAILTSFAAEYPLASADLMLSSLAAATLQAGPGVLAAPEPRPALIERAAAASLRIEPAVLALTRCVAELAATCEGGTLHVVVCEAGGAPLLAALADQAKAGLFRLSIAAADRTATERARRRSAQIEVIDLSESHDPCADVVVALSVPPRQVAGLLGEGGILLAALTRDDNLAAFQGVCPPALVGLPGDPAGEVGADAFEETVQFSDASKDLTPFVARRGRAHVREHREAIAFRALPPAPAIVSQLAGMGIELEDADVAPSIGRVACLVDCARIDLEETLLALRGLLQPLGSRSDRPRLAVAALAGGPEGAARAAAIRAFLRVAANELSGIDLRFVELSEDLRETEIAEALVGIATGSGPERESLVRSSGISVPRLRPGPPQPQPGEAKAQMLRLQFPRPGMVESFAWTPEDRPKPEAGEVEVAVEATGLNFRDVMLAMGLLNDDVLEEGLAGAVHGLECAGRIVAVGEGVTAHRVGDRVFGFGMNSFATHVVGAEQSFIALPEGLPIEAAAGIPVAFYTAWYSLVELARLRAGESVLIHGGAGGVGLAAIQIAAALGAEVIATVSSPDKEAVARLYGAAHVYDSRSLAFADAVRESHGGVDVVLNSLSGDAMRASLKCLRPRGRFIELGKRDYVANSAIGLRPFRRNLSYFGVDVDQLLAIDPQMTAKGLSAILEGFADSSYLPLPVMVHRASEVGDAFRLMQSAGHVGKIVVVPPPLETVTVSEPGAFVPGEGVQLVIGGTRGFGLATALWLAERGARRIVVASRSGKVDAASRAQIDALRKREVTVVVEQVDVADLAGVEALFARIDEAHGPVTGIYHAAVTLSDGLIENLDAEDLAAVLAPKALGARNLDRASRGQPIEQFVLYSSVSALVGNPGQAAYAAANGYLEGLARQRRAEGLPALAVQWGAIADVGLLADKADVMESLTRVSGIVPLQSAEALARLGDILGQVDRFADPVVACAAFAPNGALSSLPVATSPAFARVFAGWSSAVVEAGMSLSELIEGKSEPEAQRLLGALVAEEVAQILRLAAQDIDLDAPIDSLGMDSLMALELRMSIESRYSVELPVMAITSAGSLRELAHRILRAVRQDSEGDAAGPLSEAENALLARHGGDAGSRSLGDDAPAGSETAA
jgi:NADPH:quinone reductase-like Zn-dependent oxidoreductase/acyl carrier protein